MSKQVFGLGCQPSIIDGTERIFSVSDSLAIPKEYSFESQMPPILDQGSTNMCVTYSIGSHLDWNIDMDEFTECKDNHIDRRQLYSARSIAGDNGMTFKEAFDYLRKHGVNSDVGNVKIDYYAKINGEDNLKKALILNGPCVGGMMCYNKSSEFWKRRGNERSLGGHAISIVGYNRDGFIIRNSWGVKWANRGYSILNYKDLDLMFEIWTIID